MNPSSHYDANDDHPLDNWNHQWTLEPGDIDPNGRTYSDPDFPMFPEADITALADSENRTNIVYIKGVAYELYAWSAPDEAGERSALLRLTRPF